MANGYAFRDGLIFGADMYPIGGVFRVNKLDDGTYSAIEPAYENLPNIKTYATSYCAAEMFRRDGNTPLLLCQTRENSMLTEEENENLNEKHYGRVIATWDGVRYF